MAAVNSICEAKVIYAGIDSLDLSAGVFKYETDLSVIASAKELAQTNGRGFGTVELAGIAFSVEAKGKERYKFSLTNHDLGVRICDKPGGGRHFPEVLVSCRSAFLHRHGWKAAIERVTQWLKQWALIGGIQVSRLDIFRDVQTPLPTLGEDFRGVVTRAKKKTGHGEHREGGMAFRWDQVGLQRSGYTVGKGDLLCRIYDKGMEILKTGKDWFRDLWKQNGWVEGEAVTRIEFQCRRKFLKTMGIDLITDIENGLADLWVYLTGQWLTIREVGNGLQRTRWKLTGFWQVVQAAVDLFGMICGVTRCKQVRSSIRTAIKQLQGRISSYAAWACAAAGVNDPSYGREYALCSLQDWVIQPGFLEAVNRKRISYSSVS